jgi:RHS repeat-associated protein
LGSTFNVTVSVVNSGVEKTYPTVAGKPYTFTVNITNSTCVGGVLKLYVINASNGNIISQQNVVSGTNTVNFTATGANTKIQVKKSNILACLFNINAGTLSYQSYNYTTVCVDDPNPYRYAFNGMEKDDEVKGAGNDYWTHDRVFDPRLGRWMSMDPLFKKIPAFSSYCFSANSPIIFVDQEGDLWKVQDGTISWITPQELYGIDEEGTTNPKLVNVKHEDVFTMYAEKIYDEAMNITGIKVYNEDGTTTTYNTNSYGLVQMQNGENNIFNYSPNDVETIEGDMYLKADAATALYKTIGKFRMDYPSSKIKVGDGSTSKGDSPRLENGSDKKHGTHYQGNALDIQYLDESGTSINMGSSGKKFSKDVSNKFMEIAKKNGLNQQYHGLDNKFSGMAGSAIDGHNDHMHIGTTPTAKKKSTIINKNSNDKNATPLPTL